MAGGAIRRLSSFRMGVVPQGWAVRAHPFARVFPVPPLIPVCPPVRSCAPRSCLMYDHVAAEGSRGMSIP